MGNTTASTKGFCSAGGCTATWTPTAGSGFSSTVTNTANNSAQVYPNGTSYPSWDINMSWSSSKASGTYTANGSCSNFTTGPSGKIWRDVHRGRWSHNCGGRYLCRQFLRNCDRDAEQRADSDRHGAIRLTATPLARRGIRGNGLLRRRPRPEVSSDCGGARAATPVRLLLFHPGRERRV